MTPPSKHSSLPEDAQVHLENLKAIMARAAVGDYSHDLKPPPGGYGEFEELYAGLQTLLEDMRDRLAEIDDLKRTKKS